MTSEEEEDEDTSSTTKILYCMPNPGKSLIFTKRINMFAENQGYERIVAAFRSETSLSIESCLALMQTITSPIKLLDHNWLSNKIGPQMMDSFQHAILRIDNTAELYKSDVISVIYELETLVRHVW